MVGFSYERAVEQAYGVGGTHLGDRYNVNHAAVFARRLSTTLAGELRQEHYPDRSRRLLAGRPHDRGDLSYLMGKQLSLGAQYGLWFRDETGFATTRTYRTMFTLSYGGAW